jgi:HAD superfamily phosphoserine phosphatase-like hydrolase
MVSVIIPALNEAETVGSVVDFARKSPAVTEVLVIDDGSVDGTPDIAWAAGATVLTSALLGKGASMEEGLAATHNEVLLYLDGDLRGMHPDLVERMTRPILRGEADFVKARFSRRAGRVTALSARPLLSVFFPELAHLQQPLAGIVASRRSLLQKLRFENDYGVDIGLLIDAAARGARLAEVDSGYIEHDSQPLEALADMATQVVRTVLQRAARYGRLRPDRVRDAQEAEQRGQANLAFALRKVKGGEQLALFDMDGVLVSGRFVTELARRTHRTAALARFLDNSYFDAQTRARRIAALFAGVSREVFEQTARSIPLTPGARETIVNLRKAGFRVGIVSDSYFIAAEVVRRRVFADFSVAHLMEFSGGRATGRIAFAPAMAHERGCARHTHCKANVLHHMTAETGIDPAQVVAVGDGENDVCLLRAAGKSVAFRPASRRVRAAACHVVERDLQEVLAVVQESGCASHSIDVWSPHYREVAA